jgi:hypothetical protein
MNHNGRHRVGNIGDAVEGIEEPSEKNGTHRRNEETHQQLDTFRSRSRKGPYNWQKSNP